MSVGWFAILVRILLIRSFYRGVKGYAGHKWTVFFVSGDFRSRECHAALSAHAGVGNCGGCGGHPALCGCICERLGLTGKNYSVLITAGSVFELQLS